MAYKDSKIIFFLPLVIIGCLAILFHQSFLDEWVARHFYFSHGWIYRDSFLFEKILHKGGVLFTIFLISCLVLKLFWQWNDHTKKKQRNFILITLISSISTIAVVSLFKRYSTFPCPWNSTMFNGQVKVPDLWLVFSSQLSRQHCFPAGHSSAGFAFLSMYYAYYYSYGQKRLLALMPGVLLGVAYGGAQQVRGAHFMSHDLSTIFLTILCTWITILIFSKYDIQNEK